MPPAESTTDPIDAFRQSAVTGTTTTLAVLGLPITLVVAVQAWERHDPLLGLAAVGYLSSGLGSLYLRRRARDGPVAVPAFLGLIVHIVAVIALLETPAGTSHMLGIGCFCLMVFGRLFAPRAQHRLWHVAPAMSFAVVLVPRQLYRPHPLLADPLELFPQAIAGATLLWGLGLVMRRMFDAWEQHAALAVAADEAKSRFLQNMSHELRTPLTAILGYTEMLQEEGFDDPEAAADDLAVIHRSGAHLLGIIDDLLDLQRLAADQASLPVETVALSEVIGAAGEQVRPLLLEHHNELRIDPTAHRAAAHRTSLQRVLVALLSNAARFTDRGEVHVEVSEADDGVCICVHDTGVGLDDVSIERLFQPFVQADDAATRAHDGVGLGLAVSRRLTTAMGGSLKARPRQPRGSTFEIRLPRAA
jgi:signal transduction histidine kinase